MRRDSPMFVATPSVSTVLQLLQPHTEPLSAAGYWFVQLPFQPPLELHVALQVLAAEL